MARPTDPLEWATDETGIVAPDASKIQEGWTVGERPPAQFFNYWMNLAGKWQQALADELDTQVHPNISRSAKKNEANVFTVGPQSIEFNSSAIPCIRVNKTAVDHSGGNRWKLILEASCSDGRRIRMFTGDGATGTCWAMTLNAKWNPDTLQWSKDGDGGESNCLRWMSGELQFWGRQPGAGSWPEDQWDDQGRGSLRVGDAINTKSLGVSGGLTVGGGLTMTGPLAVTGPIDSNGDIFAGDDLIAVDQVSAGNVFVYGAAKNRVVTIGVGSGYGNGSLLGEGEYVVLTPGQGMVYPVHCPDGATMGNAIIKLYSPGTPTYIFKTKRKHSVSVLGGAASYQNLETKSAALAATTATNVVANFVSGGNQLVAVAGSEDYSMWITNSVSSGVDLFINAVQFTYIETVLTTVSSR